MSLKIQLSVLAIFLFSICSAQISFTDASWEEVLAQAKKEKKSIFVDIYTTWCGPCKKLSKTTFQDEDLGNTMNASFISTKWDAESDEHKNLAKQYEVAVFPTLLYFNSDGELIKKITGFKTVEELTASNTSYFFYINNSELRDQLNQYSNMNIEETCQILESLNDITSDDKNRIFQHLVKMIGDDGELWKDNFECIVNSIDQNLAMPLLLKLVKYHPGQSNSFNRKVLFKQAKLNHKIKQVIRIKIKKNMRENNLDGFKQMIFLEKEFKLKSNKFTPKETIEKDIEVHLMSFYLHNEMKEEYSEKAVNFIKQYISSTDVETTKNRDELVNEMLAKQKAANPELFLEMDLDKESKYIISNTFSYSVANMLNEISQAYIKLFDGKEYLAQAEEWSLLSIEYLPLARYYYDTAALMQQLGKNKQAKKLIKKGLSSEGLTDVIEEKLNTLKKELK